MKLGSTLEWRNVTVRSMHEQIEVLQNEIKLLERFVQLLESVGKKKQQKHSKKKVHWTQTVEGKKRMSIVQKTAWEKRRRA